MRKLILLASLAVLACGGDDDNPVDPGDGADFTVNVVNNDFTPSNLSVPAGSNVVWQWNSSGVTHNVTFEDQAPGSGNRSSGSFSRTFATTGDYAYVCTIHEAQGMAGVVSVTTAPTGGTGNGGTGGGGGNYP